MGLSKTQNQTLNQNLRLAVTVQVVYPKIVLATSKAFCKQ